MRIITNTIGAVSIAIAMLSGCTEQMQSPFEGTDRHFVAFSLTAGGVEYPASISEDAITVRVPADADLNRAEVRYTLSENATVSPDPAEIENWNEEQLFRVQAWNGTYIGYRYRVDRSELIDRGNVVLATQADVAAFAARKINRIDGNLVIGPATPTDDDPIRDLNPLSSLTEVGFNVVVNAGFAGESLRGLENLRQVGGFYLGSETAAVSLVGRVAVELPALEQANNIVVASDSVTVVSLPCLRSTGNLRISSKLLEALDLSKLEQTYGDLALKGLTAGNASNTNSNQELRQLDLPVLRTVGGSLTIDNFWQLPALTLPKLESTGGDLQISVVRTAERISLPALASVGGAATLQGNDGMTRFSAPRLATVASLKIASTNTYSANLKTIELPALSTVAGDLSVQFAAFETFALPALSAVGGTFQLSGMQFLEKAVFPALTSCGTVSLATLPMLSGYEVPQLGTLNGLTVNACGRLAELSLPPTIAGNVVFTATVPALTDTKRIDGTVSVASFTGTELTLGGIERIGSYSQTAGTNLLSLSFPDLATIDENLTLNNLAKLTTLSAPQLTTVGGDFSFRGSLVVDDIQLGSLTSVGRMFSFYGASSAYQASRSTIATLDAFASLATAGSVDIRYAGNLVDFSGLRNLVPTLTETQWNVVGCKYNPTYRNMADGQYTQN